MDPQQNGSGVPQWLEELKVKKGEWYSSAKARPQRLMKISLTGEAQRVYACLELATMAFQQELAVKLDKGRRVPLAPADISAQTGLRKQHVHRALTELQEHGLAERRPIEGEKRTKGNVAIYSWAVPRQDRVENGNRARLPFWESLDPEFAPLEAFASRWKIIPAKNIVIAREDLSRAMVAAAEAEETVKVAVAIVKGILAPSRIYKEERNGNKHESNGAGRQASTVVEEEPSLPACPPPVENQNGNATPRITTAEQILELPAVQELQEQLQDTIGPELASQIAVNLRDAPPEALEERIRLKAQTTRSLALLTSFAADAAKANDARKTRAQNAKQDRMLHMQAQEARTITELKQGWRKLSAADRQMAREAYPEVDWPGG